MKNKNNVIIVIGIILILLGSLLPSIRIAQENISFIKENGSLIIILVAAMFLLFKLNYKQLLYIPSILSIIIIIKFIIDNYDRLKKITELYNCYASYKYGIVVMIIGNILILSMITLEILDVEKLKKLKEKTSVIKEKVLETKELAKKNTKTVKEKIIQSKPIKQTTKDGKIRFNKITVKVDKPTKPSKIKATLNKIKIKNKNNELSISKYQENKITKHTTYEIPVIDIKKWTQSDICCSNCGATVHTTSEYCFLCDCKIKLNKEKEKLS